MSRFYDAKQAALKAHPNDIGLAVDLFIGYVDMYQSDIVYELGVSIRHYIFGRVDE